MKKSKLILAGILIVCLSTGSFAVTAKGENKSETPAVVKSETGTVLYWYKVSYDNPTTYPNGYVKAGAMIQAHDEQDNVVADCESGTTLDCFRGFVNPQSSVTGLAGDGQIKTDDQP